MFWTRTEKVDSNLVDLDKLNLTIAGALIFAGYWSISDEFRFRGCSTSILYLFIRKPHWRTG